MLSQCKRDPLCKTRPQISKASIADNTKMRRPLTSYLPDWTLDWLEIIVPGIQIFLILLVAWLLQYLLRRLVNRAGQHYTLPLELTLPLKGFIRWSIMIAALLLVLERLGVSATVLWTAFTGFATVGAVAFFAAWSVLSNLFCAFLIFTVGPFRRGDIIEVLDTAEKPGARGRVIDINLLYTTLEDSNAASAGTLLQIPNALIFQRVVRRWKDGEPPFPVTLETPKAPDTAR
jgi:small-conductance mechanosensitive channel